MALSMRRGGVPGVALLLNSMWACNGRRSLTLRLRSVVPGWAPGGDGGIDLTVNIIVGAVQLGLEPAGVEEDVGRQAGQGAQDVVGGEIMLAGDVDAGEFSFHDAHMDHAVGDGAGAGGKR